MIVKNCGSCRHHSSNMEGGNRPAAVGLCWSPKPRAVTTQTSRIMDPEDGVGCPAHGIATLVESAPAHARSRGVRLGAWVVTAICALSIPLLTFVAGESFILAAEWWEVGDLERALALSILGACFTALIFAAVQGGLYCWLVASPYKGNP